MFPARLHRFSQCNNRLFSIGLHKDLCLSEKICTLYNYSSCPRVSSFVFCNGKTRLRLVALDHQEVTHRWPCSSMSPENL